MTSQKIYICILLLSIVVGLWYITLRITEPFRIYEKCKYDHYVMTEEEIARSYELMKDVTYAFDKYNIQYFIVGGTLLGSIRHGGIMPWDDDMDIGVIDSDIDKMHIALDELVKMNKITYADTDFGIIKVYSIHNDEYPFMDIFYYTKKEDRYIFKLEQHNEMWPDCWFHESELFPLQKGRFGDLHVNTPFMPLPHLERSFGSTWNTEYKDTHVYKKGASLETSSGILTDDILCYF
jgi:lipopolysaccharide cholinephosphotransferase